MNIIWKNISIDNREAIIESAENCKIEVFDKKVYLNGEDVDNILHTDQIDALVSPVSAIPNVRHKITAKIQDAAKNYNIIAEGRDMTTVVFPNAEVKIYLDASIENRAKRRLNQGVSSKNLAEIEAGIKERDEIDKNKELGSLKIAEDAIYLNSSDLTIKEVYEKILTEIIKKRN